MKRITTPEEIEPGRYYFCCPKDDTFDASIEQAFGTETPTTKYLGNRIWANSKDADAFKKWIIVGPINFPEFDKFI